MSVLEGVLLEELERIKRNIASYNSILSSLPKGYIFMQEINGNSYCYRKHRENGKIISEYLGPNGSDIVKEAQSNYLERKRVEANLRILRKDEKRLIKALRHYGN